MKTVENITEGEVLLVSAKVVRNGKISLEFAQKIKNPNAKGSNSIIGLLNKSDDRFTQSGGARRAWITGERTDIESMLGLDLSKAENEGDIVTLNVLNPEIGGEKVMIQITETTEANDYQAANIEATAKRAGKDGDFIYSGGKHVFSNSQVVAGYANHTFLKSDAVGQTVEAGAEAEMETSGLTL